MVYIVMTGFIGFNINFGKDTRQCFVVGTDSNTCMLELFLTSVDFIMSLLDTTWTYCSN